MGIVFTALAILIAGAVALPVGWFVSVEFGWWAYMWLGPLLTFIVCFMAVNAMLGGLLGVLALAGGGMWSLSPVRWMVGKAAFLALAVPPSLVALYVFDRVGLGWTWLIAAFTHPVLMFVPFASGADPHLTGLAWYNAAFVAPSLRLGIFSLTVVAVLKAVQMEKPAVAWATLPMRRVWRALKTGLGGSAALDGLMDEWLMPWKPGQVILGTSLYEPGQRLGRFDDRHLLTIATTRSGKGRSCVIPNLLTWPGSALVIDPKGQNAAVTARARRNMGQEIHIIDPFGLLADLGLDPAAYPVQRFNPLAAIELDALDVVEQIGNVADALIIRSDHGNPFWDNASKAVLVGIIAHVLTWPKLRDGERNLATVRDYVSETNGRKLTDMAGHAGAAGLTAVAVSELKRASESAGGDILTTLATHVKWLDSLAMRKALAVSEFDLNTLKKRQATLYLVIPPDYLDEHARFLRLFITLAIRAAGRGVKARHPMLFILDEFAALGPLKVVEQAAGLLAGGGVRLWPIIQNLTQLRPYGDNWEVFLANAGQIQVFAVNDQATARYFSERLGHHMAWRKVRNASGRTEWVPQGATWFRTSAELARESSRDSGRALIFYEGGAQAVVRRASYDKLFSASEYSPDPYEAGRPLSWSARWAWLMAELDRDGGESLWNALKEQLWGAQVAAPEPEPDMAQEAAAAADMPPRPESPEPAPPPPAPDRSRADFDAMILGWAKDIQAGKESRKETRRRKNGAANKQRIG